MSTCVVFLIGIIASAWAQDRYCGSITATTCGSQARAGCTEISTTTTVASASACESLCQQTANCWYFEYVTSVVAATTCTLYADNGNPACAGCANPVATTTGSETGYCNAQCKSVQPGDSSQNAAPGTACTDSSTCTTNDVCNSDGKCVGTVNGCNDNNTCTIDSCDQDTGACIHTEVTCDNGNLCDVGQCDTETGNCTYFVRACFQSSVEHCIHNSCDPSTGNCTSSPVVCDDNNLCTVDSCDNSTGCIFSTVACIESQAQCNISVCNNNTGNCEVSSQQRECNDFNSCTSDQCVQGQGCIYTPKCNQGNACVTDTCNAWTGTCNVTNVNCDDGLACTIDTCNITSGCVHTANCNDNNACTIDSCASSGQCSHTPLLCINAFSSCTVYTCDPQKGCVGAPKNCNDNNACTDDSCSNGQCINTNNCLPPNNCTITFCNIDIGYCGVQAADCNDGLECTTDTCNDATGCVHTSTCNDNNACTRDTCGSNGLCTYTTIPCLSVFGSCTVASCTPAKGCVGSPVICNTPPVCYYANGTCVPHIGQSAATCAYTPEPSGTPCTGANRYEAYTCNGAGTCSANIIVRPFLGSKFSVQDTSASSHSSAAWTALAYVGCIAAVLVVALALHLFRSRRSSSGRNEPEQQSVPIFEYQL